MKDNLPEEFSFGAWLRQRRRSLDLTQQKLADQVGCARITLRRIEADALKPSKELAQILLEKLGVPETERPKWILFARGMGDFPETPELRSQGPQPPSNLPTPITSFVGRETDIVRIKQRIAEHRLVTLIGAGGIGKTRLSQEVARQVLEEYPNGLWLVELAPLSDPALVSQTVATVLGIQPQAGQPTIDILIQVLHAKTTLLILDNCEHLLDACAQLADRLLKSCPNLRILATSREALGITGEALYHVPALTVPEVQWIESPEMLANYESTRLFGERAQLVQMDFAVTTESASSIARICSRLDGIPLAIELAAAQVQTFSAEQIASQLDESFRSLRAKSPTELPRHQSLQASIDWSWNLLPDLERIVFRRLSVFSGGFTLESASQVCAEGEIQVQAVISQLLAKSLVAVDHAAAHERRYHLLETIRQYAHEKLIPTGEESNIRTRHLEYFLDLSRQAELALKGPAQVEWYTRLIDERDNIRSALEWAEQTNVEAGLWISGSLWRFWEDFDLREGEGWLKKFLAKIESHDHLHARAKALYAYGIILYLTQQYVPMKEIAEECLSLYRTLGDLYGEIDGLIVLGRYRFATNDLTRRELIQQAFVLSESLGDVWRQAFTLGHIGWDSGHDYQQRISYFKEAISRFRKAGDFRELQEYLGTLGNYEILGGDLEAAQEHVAEAMQLSKNPYFKGAMHFLSALGQIESIRGNFEKARALLEESIENANKLGNRNHYLWDRTLLGHIIVRQGKDSDANEIFFETAQEFLKDNNEIGVVFSLEGMAGIYVATNKPAVAARLIGWADATRLKIDDPRPLLEQADVDKIIAACLAEMGETAFSVAYEAGRRMSLDEAMDLALKRVEQT